jgi:acyl-CoA thioester hydrolase
MLNISIAIGEITKISFEIYYEITTTRNSNNILIAKAKTGMVCFDYSSRKVAAIPAVFVDFLNN